MRAPPTSYAAVKDAEEKKANLEEEIAKLSSAALEISSDLAALCRAHVDAMTKTLSNPEVVHRASKSLGELIERIVIRHDAELGHTAQIEGNLLEMLLISAPRKLDAVSGAIFAKLVAGA